MTSGPERRRASALPLVPLTDAMLQLAEGDHAVVIPAGDRHDEVGDMAKAVQGRAFSFGHDAPAQFAPSLIFVTNSSRTSSDLSKSR
ncbi:MAG: HAMP domain-containing protein [Rhodospirillaceae bacterium]